jgi:hypothetical protein
MRSGEDRSKEEAEIVSFTVSSLLSVDEVAEKKLACADIVTLVRDSMLDSGMEIT